MALGMLGRYRLIRKLAQGGMAEVFLAKSYGAHGFEKPVAIKRILSRFAADEQFVTMLIDEARITSLLSHPNIVPVTDFNADGSECYLVMEYVSGRSMAGLLRALGREQRALSLEHLLYIIREVAAGLHHAHNKVDRGGVPLNIVHRDVSPQNILLSFEGFPKIIDFGIARARDRLAQTEAGTLKGKLRYLAPEQIDGSAVDGRTDLFALAITLWEALCGRALFTGDSDVKVIDAVLATKVPDPRDFNADVPPELSRSLLKALSRSAKARHPSCEAFAADLRGILARLNPDHDPAALGTLMRKEFAQELEEDAREEAEAEADLERAGAAAPPADEQRRVDRTPAHPAEAARARKDRAQKGVRPAEARRMAEQQSAEAQLFLTDQTVNEPDDMTVPGSPPEVVNKGVVVPMPEGTPTAKPNELTRSFDPLLMDVAPVSPPRVQAPPARPPPPPVASRSARPPRHLALMALLSAVGGAVVAVGLGMVVVARLDATPSHLAVPNAELDPLPQGDEPGPPPLHKARAVVTLRVSPATAELVLDGEPLAAWDAPVVLPPGRHILEASAVDHQAQRRALDLEDGQRVEVEVALEPNAPLDRAEPVEGKAATREPSPRSPRASPQHKARSAEPNRRAPSRAARNPGPAAPARPGGRGTLRIITPGTWANVTIDGKKLTQFTPVEVEVSAGEHDVTLKRGGVTRNFTVSVPAGGSQLVRGEM